MLEKTGAKDDTEILDLDFRARWEQKPERDREGKIQKEGRREGEKEWMGKPTANLEEWGGIWEESASVGQQPKHYPKLWDSSQCHWPQASPATTQELSQIAISLLPRD